MTAAELAAEGWRPIMGFRYGVPLPPPDHVVEFAREDAVYRQLPWFGKWGEFPPQFNVYGLWWRPVE